MTPRDTGTERMLDAADACRAAQAELSATMALLVASVQRMELQGAQIAAAASVITSVADRIVPSTWRGGLVAVLLLLGPSVLALAAVVLLLGRGGDLAALVVR